jgi:mono/diheme cytochrome c family protein
MKWIALGAAAIAIIAFGGWTLFTGSDGPARIPYGDRAAVERGAVVYTEACAACHGKDLEGQPNWRERLPSGRLPAPPHDESGHTWHHTDDHLFKVTKYGVASFAPAGYESDMPGFEDQLSDADILASLAYIKSRWPESIKRRHDMMNGATQ